jgi:hypothetical protein
MVCQAEVRLTAQRKAVAVLDQGEESTSTVGLKGERIVRRSTDIKVVVDLALRSFCISSDSGCLEGGGSQTSFP